MATLSPGFAMVIMAATMASVPPQVMTISSSGLMSKPIRADCFAARASLVFLAPQVMEIMGGAPHFPSGYKLKKKTDNFIWIADEKQYTNQGVFIYKYPATEAEPFSLDNIIRHRNQFLKENVPGMFDGTYMITADYIPPTVSYLQYKGRSFAQCRGFWEVYNDFMGGPFVSHSFYSQDGKDVIVLEAFVYAPKYDKRQYLRQVESILYSFEWESAKE